MSEKASRTQKQDTAPPPRAARARLLMALLLVGIGLAFLGYRVYDTLTETPPPQLLTLGDDITFGAPPPLPANDLPALQESLARVRILENVAMSRPKDPQARLDLALEAMQAGEILTAQEGFQTYLRVEPRPDPRAYESLALCEVQLGLLSDAIKTYQKLVTVAPQYVRGYTGLSKAQADTEQRQEGLQTLEQGVRNVAPQDITGRLELVNEFERRGDLPRALGEAQAIQSRPPEDPRVTKAVATLLLKMGRLSEARPLLEKLVAAYPNDNAARRLLANAVNNPLLPKPDPALTEHLLLEVLRRDRQDTQACLSLGQLYQAQGRFRQAACIYTWLLHVVPDSASGRLQLARAYTQMGDKRTGSEQQEIAQKLVLRDREEARLRPRLSKRPTDPQAHFALGRHYVTSGQFTKALPELQAAYRLASDSAEIRRAVMDLYVQVGVQPPANVSGKQ